MTADSILAELSQMGSEQTKSVLMKHGAREPFFGVKVENLKKIQKRIKKDYLLSLELYQTGNSDAMYLAGLIADEQRMNIADLQGWVEQAYWYMLSDYTVAWVAAESRFARELASRWIDDPRELVASAGWCTWSNWLAITPNEQIDPEEITALLQRVEDTLHTSPNRVRYSMNGFVIAAGSFVPDLNLEAMSTAKALGKVFVEMGGTACKVPYAPEYIQKVVDAGKLGKKKKMARC